MTQQATTLPSTHPSLCSPPEGATSPVTPPVPPPLPQRLGGSRSPVIADCLQQRCRFAMATPARQPRSSDRSERSEPRGGGLAIPPALSAGTAEGSKGCHQGMARSRDEPGWLSCCGEFGNWAWDGWDAALWGCVTSGCHGRQQPHPPGFAGNETRPKSALSPWVAVPPVPLIPQGDPRVAPSTARAGTAFLHPLPSQSEVLGAVLALDQVAQHGSCQPSTSCGCLGCPSSQNPLSVPPTASPAPGEPSGLNIQERSLCTFCKDQAAPGPGNSLPLLPGMRLNEFAE